MENFVKLKRTHGSKGYVYVNPRHVIAVAEGPDNTSLVCFGFTADGYQASEDVEGDAEYVTKKLENSL